MYSLHLTCRPEEIDDVALVLWEAGTEGIREEDDALIAAFPDEVERDQLSVRLAAFQPRWQQEEDIDWVAATREKWPGREIGQRIFLAPLWNCESTPAGRLRVVHNPGMASGTGEHPCSQLAWESLERSATQASVVVDVGTGSGLLALAAMALGIRFAVGLDISSLDSARENVSFNERAPSLVMGSVDCIASEIADVVVANISGSVLLSLADELWRVGKPNSWLILTGFPEAELGPLESVFGRGEVTSMDEWRCLTIRNIFQP